MIPVADFLPTASLEILQQRAALLRQIREFFTRHGYWEAQTPILSRDSCIDAWLDPFSLHLPTGEQVYLQTSPEFALKRLICAGADRVFEVARVFRQDEMGVRHNPEFTMIEWYERDCDHHAQMDLVEALVRMVRGISLTHHQNAKETALPAKFSRLSYEQAFKTFTGLSASSASLQELTTVAAAQGSGLPRGIEQDREGLLNLLLADVVEPGLKQLQAVFLYDFPPAQAALAKINPGPPAIAERFELYLDGIEICNGYHELTDPVELHQRMQQQNEIRLRMGKAPIPSESRLLRAMEHGLPNCSGVALGFDRLAAWCLGLESIREILAFPFDRA